MRRVTDWKIQRAKNVLRIGKRGSEPFRREHEELLTRIEHIGQAAREVPRLGTEEREALVGRILEFLRGTLVPHAKAEEEVLYPEWTKLVGYDGAAVPLVHDHEAIVARIERLEQAEVDDVDTVQELLYGLYTLISVHLRKEEDIQLPDFDAAPPDVTRTILERMGALAGDSHPHRTRWLILVCERPDRSGRGRNEASARRDRRRGGLDSRALRARPS